MQRPGFRPMLKCRGMGCCPRTKRREPRGFAPHPLPPEDTAPSVATVTKGVFFTPMKTRKLALNAVLAAMCAALGALALDLNSIKITFESFPILLGALLFGPLDGLAVGFVGTLLYQLLRYGVSVTTPLWILPYALAGLVTGFYARRRGFSLTTKQTVGIVVAAEVLITALNTLVMYIDAKLYGYWFPGFISAMLLPRGAVCIVKAVVFGLVLPKLCARVRRALPGEGEKTHGA